MAYTITQSATAGWDLFQLSCNTGETVSLASRQVTIVLTPGEQVVCTFSNRLSPPPNDNFANLQVVTGWQGTVGGTTIAGTRESGEPGLGSGPSVWYRWDLPAGAGGPIMIDTCHANTNFDTVIGIYTGSSVSALTTIMTNDDNADCGSNRSRVVFSGAGSYLIQVTGFNGASGTFALHYELI